MTCEAVRNTLTSPVRNSVFLKLKQNPFIPGSTEEKVDKALFSPCLLFRIQVCVTIFSLKLS